MYVGWRLIHNRLECGQTRSKNKQQVQFGFEKNIWFSLVLAFGFGSVLKNTVGSVFFVDQL